MRRQFLRFILPENRWGDAVYARIDYRLRLGRFPRTKNPQTYNEHLAKMRVEGSLLDPLRQFVSDKEYVKTYISGVVGEKYAVKTYQILKTADDVERFIPRVFRCPVARGCSEPLPTGDGYFIPVHPERGDEDFSHRKFLGIAVV